MMGSRDEALVTGLEAVVQRIFCDEAKVDHLARLTGGASYETWAFQVKVPNRAAVPLVLRRMPPGVVALSYSTGPETEAKLISIAEQARVPVPGIRYVLTEFDNLGRGFIAELVEGETLGSKIVRASTFADVRPKLAYQCGQILARIHQISPPQLPTLLALDQIKNLYGTYTESGYCSPIFELAFQWLLRNAPADFVEPRLVHGDFRNGNLIVGEEGIRAVLDWELTHVGDAAEDMGWLTVNSWRFGEISNPVGGFGSVPDLLAGYVDAGGPPISEDRIKYWRIMGSLRWGIMCLQMSQETEDAGSLSIERVMIGRRTSETEIDLLNMLTGSGNE